MPLLSQLGICELAVGVLSGWAMVMTIESPDCCDGPACATSAVSARPTSTSSFRG
jgi:hypothetical protein